MTMTQFAGHLGITKGAISQQIEKGNLVIGEAFVEEWQGKKKHLKFNPVIAEAQWRQNAKTDRTPFSQKEAPKIQGRLKPAEKEAAAFLAATGSPHQHQGKPKPTRTRGANATPQKEPEMSPEQAEVVDLRIRKQRAEVEKAEADALKARIEVEKAAGLLVDADETEDLLATLICDTRDVCMVLPQAFRADFPNAPQEEMDFLDAYIKTMLCGMAPPERVRVDVARRIESTEAPDAVTE